jgi:predicted GNAT family acetyltransferase
MDVQHQPGQQRFVVKTGSHESVLEYRLLPDGNIDFSRTFVPEELRGRGIAEKLARTGIAWAREQGFALQASCWYVRRFIERGRRRD